MENMERIENIKRDERYWKRMGHIVRHLLEIGRIENTWKKNTFPPQSPTDSISSLNDILNIKIQSDLKERKRMFRKK